MNLMKHEIITMIFYFQKNLTALFSQMAMD